MLRRTTLGLGCTMILLGACGDDAATTTGGTTTGTGGSTTTAATTSNASSSGTGGLPEYIPTAADVEFAAVAPIPSGESILFNDWDSSPNSVWAMSTDGATETEIFRAYRVWSMGVSNAGDSIAFSCGDPHQEEHFGLTIGDAIQHTFLYDVGAQSLKLLAHGNINDECHTFAPGDQTLYVCRRYDFTPDFKFKGYRIGEIHLSDLAFDWLTDESSNAYALYPAPKSDGSAILYTEVPVPSGQRSIVDLDLGTKATMLLRQNTSAPVISPDGTRYLFTDYGDAGALHVSDLDGQNEFVVAVEQASGARWSPDGTRVVFMVDDAADNCQHVDVAHADGSDANAPTRIYDCATKGRFITEVAWIARP